jgi:DNA repair exonuclease SbcCD nuclease subunit
MKRNSPSTGQNAASPTVPKKRSKTERREAENAASERGSPVKSIITFSEEDVAAAARGRLVLFVGDPHFKRDNVAQSEAYVNEIIRVFEQCPPGTVCLLAGDVLDAHGIIYINPLRRAMELIRSLVTIGPTVVLVGNHDYMSNQEFLSDNHWMIALEPWAALQPDLVVASRPVARGDLVFTPYVPTGRLADALDSTHRARSDEPFDWKSDAACVFAHQEVRGVFTHGGSAGSVQGDPWSASFPPLVSGHIHTSQRVGSNVIYPGSVISHSFGHGGDSAIHLVRVGDSRPADIRDVDVVVTPVPISVPRRRTEVVSASIIMQAKSIKSKEMEDILQRVAPVDALERVRVRIELPNTAASTDVRVKRFMNTCMERYASHDRSAITFQSMIKLEDQWNEDEARSQRNTQLLSFGAILQEELTSRGQHVVDYMRELGTMFGFNVV